MPNLLERTEYTKDPKSTPPPFVSMLVCEAVGSRINDSILKFIFLFQPWSRLHCYRRLCECSGLSQAVCRTHKKST